VSVEQFGESFPDPIPPVLHIPAPTFGQRVNQYATNRQFNVLDRNLRDTHLKEWLADRAVDLDGRPTNDPRDGFTAITDKLVGANPVEYDETGGTFMTLQFEEDCERENFHRLYEQLLAGIPLDAKKHQPYFRNGTEQGVLEAYNFSYPYLSTAARVGDLLLRRANKGVPYLNELSNWPIFMQERAGLANYWPQKVQERIAYHKGQFNEFSWLASGHLSLIGRRLRAFAKEQGTTDQIRTHSPHDERPEIEKGTHFFTTKVDGFTAAAINDADDQTHQLDVPMSGASLGQELWAQFSDRGAELRELYNQRKLVRLGQQLWELASGLGIAEGAGAAAEALITVTGAVSVATYGTIADKVRSTRHHR